ncbi:MAG: DUF2752 domain-containing protein [Lachnospiraceae bacterium]|nr:DUF2752 domain-containing protein [Lachnospiraceae bacterium]
MSDRQRDKKRDNDKKPFPFRKWLFEPVSDRALFYIGLVAGILLAAGWIVYRMYFESFTPGECAFKRVTGLYCPGCGGTRAADALFSGHFIRAFIYHPFVPYCLVMWVLYEGSHLLEILHVPHIKGMKFRNAYMWTGLGILLVNWIVKNILLIVLNLR